MYTAPTQSTLPCAYHFSDTTMQKFASVSTGIVLLATLGAFAATAAAATKAMDLPCVQKAVDVRESATQAAFAAFSSAQTKALTDRAAALHNSWGQENASARRSARTASWNVYKAANKDAMDTLHAAKRAAWTAFGSASLACGVEVVEKATPENAGSLGL